MSEEETYPKCHCCKNIGKETRAFYVWEYPVFETANPEAIGDSDQIPVGRLTTQKIALCLEHIKGIPVLMNELRERGLINPALEN